MANKLRQAEEQTEENVEWLKNYMFGVFYVYVREYFEWKGHALCVLSFQTSVWSYTGNYIKICKRFGPKRNTFIYRIQL